MKTKDILNIIDLSISFGGIVALDKVSFDVKESSITSLIGPNGAGKTTLFNCITGFYKATQGELKFASKKGEMDICKVLGEKLILQDIYNPFRLFKKVKRVRVDKTLRSSKKDTCHPPDTGSKTKGSQFYCNMV